MKTAVLNLIKNMSTDEKKKKRAKKELIFLLKNRERVLKASNLKFKLKLLGIDPATVTGWAMGVKPEESGIWNLKVKRTENMGFKLLQFEETLKSFIKEKGIGVVASEMPVNNRNTGATIHHSKLSGIIQKVCHELGVEFVEFTPSEIKKFATGIGNANKELMGKAYRLYFGDSIESHDRVDAIFIYIYLKHYLVGKL